MKTIFNNTQLYIYFLFLFVVLFHLGCVRKDEIENIELSNESVIVDSTLNQYIHNYIFKFQHRRQFLVFQIFCTKSTYKHKEYLLTSQIALKKLLQYRPSGCIYTNGEAVLMYSGFDCMVHKKLRLDRKYFIHKQLVFSDDALWNNPLSLYSKYNFTRPSWLLEYNCELKTWSMAPCYDTIVYGKETLPPEKTLHYIEKNERN